MSVRSERQSPQSGKKSKVLKPETSFVTISIKLSDFENISYLKDEVETIRVVGKFMSTEIECKTSSDGFKCQDSNVEIEYQFSVNAFDNEEVFDLFSNPIQCKSLLTFIF